jgi:hypothetical protein
MSKTKTRLAQYLHAALKFFGGEHLVSSARGSGSPVSTCAVIILARPIPSEVFHELARQLDRIPFRRHADASARH